MFDKILVNIEAIDDNHTDRLDTLLDEITNSTLSMPEKIILKGFIDAKKEYAEIKNMSTGSEPAFYLAARRLDVFRNYANR